MDLGEEFLFLTPKGTEELRSRAHKLDFTARNVLFLIERGCTTAEAILQRTIFPRDAVTDRLRRLLGNKFVAVVQGDGPVIQVNGTARPRAGGAATAGFTVDVPAELRLELGVSLSQARFALTDFCLNQFGTRAKPLVDSVNLAADVAGLQQALNRIGAEVHHRCADRMPDLVECVRDINDTDANAGATAEELPTTVPARPMEALRSATVDQLQLAGGISLTQARFALADFCLDHFGVAGQHLVVEINRSEHVAELQKVLGKIRAEVVNRCRDRLPKLYICVREINEVQI